MNTVSPNEKNRHRVLVVDDEPDIRESIFELISADFDCTLAANGAEAFNLISENSYDVVLTDADMPKLNGFELVRRMHESAIETPVIILTGRGTGELLRQTTAFNIFDYVEKPFHPVRLIELLRVCCGAKWKTTRGPDTPNSVSKVMYEDFDIRINRRAADLVKTLAEKNGVSISTTIEQLILKPEAN